MEFMEYDFLESEQRSHQEGDKGKVDSKTNAHCASSGMPR